MSAKSYCQPFVCELSCRDFRGLTTSFFMLSYCSGMTVITFLGSVIVDWRIVVSSLALVAILCFVGTIVIHESPEWLVEKELLKSAKEAWVYYNPDSHHSEFDQLTKAILHLKTGQNPSHRHLCE